MLWQRGTVQANMSNMISSKIIKRGLWVAVGFVALWGLLVLVLFNLQIINYDEYQRQVINQLTVETEVNPERGSIYDRNGNLLATNKTVYLVFISPQDIIDAMEEEPEKTYTVTGEDGTSKNYRLDELIAAKMSEILSVDRDFVYKKTGLVGRMYEVIKQRAEESEADALRAFIDEHGLSTMIYLRAGAIRYYPYGSLAAHAIGFTNADGVGIYGVENSYNNLLEGTSGRYITAQDANNNDMPFEYETYIEASNGYNIVTTLDMYIQYELENQLRETLIESKANNRVTGIVMDVETSGIYAMATLPSFDLNSPYTLDEYSQAKLDAYAEEHPEGSDEYVNKYYELLYQMWNNKAVNDLYEPGSTFKIMTVSIALETGAAKTSDTFFCSGALKIDGYGSPISCHKRTGHGSETLEEGLQQSCNPVMMTIASRVGRSAFYDYFKMFGYTAKTGIDLPGEASTYYHAYQDFSGVSLAVYSFGQTFKTTPIQQITAVSSVANGGNLVTPHILKEIVDDDGNVIQSYEPTVKRQVVSADVCETVSQILEEGVSGNGGAKNAYVKGYKVAAKTGTSEKRDKFDENGQASYRVGSCVAYAPADDPQVAVIIIVDEPMCANIYGSVVAAPYVSGLLSFVLPYLGVEAQYDDGETTEIQISSYVGVATDAAVYDLKEKGITYEVVGEGTTVTEQVPKGGSTILSDSGRVILYTGDETPKATVTVPDVIGKSAAEATKLLLNAGLNVRITGAQNYEEGVGAEVVAQSIPEGEKVPRGELVDIELRHMDGSD